MIGYGVGTIAFDYIIGKVKEQIIDQFVAERYSISTRVTYATSIPITGIAAVLVSRAGGISEFPIEIPNFVILSYIQIALIITFLGTCGYNLNEEKPFDMSTEAVSY